MTSLEHQLLAALKEMREACCAAMRVVADCDMAGRIGMSADARQMRLVDEMHIAGVKDGFGKRADDLIRETDAMLKAEREAQPALW